MTHTTSIFLVQQGVPYAFLHQLPLLRVQFLFSALVGEKEKMRYELKLDEGKHYEINRNTQTR